MNEANGKIFSTTAGHAAAGCDVMKQDMLPQAVMARRGGGMARCGRCGEVGLGTV